jgi:tetrahydromethanopterin S-methyltransferase subunit G
MHSTKAESEALQGVLAEALDSQLATKNDLIKLDRRLDGIDAKIDRMDAKMSGELTLLKWMLGILIASIMSIVIKTFFS